MGGALLPDGIFTTADPWWASLTATAPAAHWIHHWFAFVVFAGVTWLLVSSRRVSVPGGARRAIHVAAALVGLQILLGISVLWFYVPISLAFLH